MALEIEIKSDDVLEGEDSIDLVDEFFPPSYLIERNNIIETGNVVLNMANPNSSYDFRLFFSPVKDFRFTERTFGDISLSLYQEETVH
jgi:hypothetical protein